MPQHATLYQKDVPVEYRDFYLRLAACLIASHILVVYGETRSTFEMMLMPEYYYAVGGSTVIALILFTIMRGINIKLDRKFGWRDKTVERVGMQFFWGLAVPSVVAFLLAAAYFFFRGANILQTSYLRYDFQVVLMQLLLINLYYIAYYFYQQWTHAEKTISQLALLRHEPAASHKETFMVSKGSGNLLLPLDTIAYFYRNGDNNYVRTINAEDYFVNTSLDEIQQQLPEDRFFRANRQILTHRQAVKGYDLMEYGKLEAKFSPALSIDTVISQKRAKEFKQWVDSK
nr:LytTR family DNA-binding domain-containing protein [Pedobacter sp. ASV19]